MLLLLPAEPVARGDSLRPLGPLLEPALYGGAELRVRAQALGEGDVRKGAVEAPQELPQRPQTLKLLGAVEAVARGGASGLDEARALDVAQHPRRPSGRLRSLVDREPLHRRRKPYHDRVKVYRAAPSAGPTPRWERDRRPQAPPC